MGLVRHIFGQHRSNTRNYFFDFLSLVVDPVGKAMKRGTSSLCYLISGSSYFDFFFKVGKRVGFRTLACVRTSESIKVLTSFRLMRLVPHLC